MMQNLIDDPQKTKSADIQSHLDQIQGNIIGGFNKDYQTFLFLKFKDPGKGRRWVSRIVSEIASSKEVLAFNQLFKVVKERSHREGIVKATWTNIAFTHSGLQALGISDTDLKLFPDDFKDGLAARAREVGDVGNNAPEKWVGQLGSKDVHALLIVASDSSADLKDLVDSYVKEPIFKDATTIVFRQEGRTRFDEPGHEHFGFKDGVSQPGIRGITESLADDPNKGKGHEDLLYPGEFVLGYPKQIPHPGKDEKGKAVNPNHDPGEISKSGPEWTKNGSYLVFRRLSQDVQAFRDTVNKLAQTTGLDAAVLGAKLVGRYKSGAPLEQTDEQEKQTPPIDPTKGDPSLKDPSLLSDDKINDFEYGKDLQGQFVPRAAHIRKTYPRDQEGGAGSSSESETQTHRLLRRGIPFGKSLDASKPDSAEGKCSNDRAPSFWDQIKELIFGKSLDAPEPGITKEELGNDRGLLFLAYQTSIENQFEFVQQKWVNDPNFPCNAAKQDGEENICQDKEADGQDPIIAQSTEGPFKLPPKEGSGCPVHNLNVQHFVTTTGGEYFFQPSIDAIYKIAGETPPAV